MKNSKTLSIIILALMLIPIALLLITAFRCAEHEKWAPFGFCLFMVLFLTICFTGTITGQVLNRRFDKLERLLSEIKQNDHQDTAN